MGQHRELVRCGPALVEQLGERRRDRAAGEKHVVQQDEDGAVHIGGNNRRRKLLGDRIAPDVVPVKRDVERADILLPQPGAEAAQRGDASVGGAEQDKVGIGRAAGSGVRR